MVDVSKPGKRDDAIPGGSGRELTAGRAWSSGLKTVVCHTGNDAAVTRGADTETLSTVQRSYAVATSNICG